MYKFTKYAWICSIAIALCMLLISCGDDDPSTSSGQADSGDDDTEVEGDDDTVGADDDVNDDVDDDDPPRELQREKLEAMFEEMGFRPYLEFEPVREEEIWGGYTRYFYSMDDLRCYDGSEANVAISFGDSDNVIFFMDGGGASWPGYFFGFEIDMPRNEGYISRRESNPLRDWNIVYVPYCGNDLHAGDNEIEGLLGTQYHHGARHTAAAAALMKQIFPNPDKILLTGISAGGFGTFFAWPIVKSLYMDTQTYIHDDAGVGFWNPDAQDTFDVIMDAWNLRIPSACVKCQNSTVKTWLFELYMEYDPSLRVGMFTSYQDYIISELFLGMTGPAFQAVTLDVTGQIKNNYPDQFARFFIKGRVHTSSLLGLGPNYSVDGTSLYDWVGMLVSEDPAWDDLLQ